MGSPISPVMHSIYMEYFEELVLGPEFPGNYSPASNNSASVITASYSR